MMKMNSTKRSKRKKNRNRFKFFSVIVTMVIVIGGILITQSYLNNKEKKNSLEVQASKNENSKDEVQASEDENKKEVKAEERKIFNINEDNAKFAIDVHEVRKILDGKAESDGKKQVFLTFDDGPSTTVTPKILDVLKQNDVRATFFLVGSAIDKANASKDIIKKMYNDGHAIGTHSYTHNYTSLYPNQNIDINLFFNETDKTINSIKNIIGEDFKSRVLRMPGGYMSRKYYKSKNLSEFDEKLKELDMDNVDWNALSGDAEGNKKNAEQLFNRAKETSQGKNKIIMLMHDTYGKEATAEALPKIISWLKENGYEFKTIS